MDYFPHGTLGDILNRAREKKEIISEEVAILRSGMAGDCLTLYHTVLTFSPLPNGKILDKSKFKAFADDKINVVEMMISLCDRVENIVGKGENAGYKHFLLFPHFFQNSSFSW